MPLDPSRPLQLLPTLPRSAPAESSSGLETEETVPHLDIPGIPQDEDTFAAAEAALSGVDKGKKKKRKAAAISSPVPPMTSASPIQEEAPKPED